MGSGKKELSPEEILSLLGTLEKITDINLDTLENQRFEALRPVDRLVEDLRNDKKLRRGPKGMGRPKAKRQHWKTLRKKKRIYHAVRGKRLKMEALAEKLTTPEGWYEHVTYKWKREGHTMFTLDEWVNVIWPDLGGRVPYFNRYDTGKGFTLDNVVVYEAGTNKVLFDGMEHRMKKLGYLL
jgi:hypothetical protein